MIPDNRTMSANANAIGMSIIKIRVLGHAGKGIFQDFPQNQNLLLFIGTGLEAGTNRSLYY